jgi:chromosome segregation ATPase
LREEHAELTATSASTASKLERITLQRDGGQTQITDLERLNDELKRNNAELKRQMDKWQNLETKGGAEVDNLRKRRIELEVQVKEFEGRLADAGKIEQERDKALEKEKKKVEKLKGVIDSWRVRIEC